MAGVRTTNSNLRNSAHAPLLQAKIGRFFEADLLLLLRRQAH